MTPKIPQQCVDNVRSLAPSDPPVSAWFAILDGLRAKRSEPETEPVDVPGEDGRELKQKEMFE